VSGNNSFGGSASLLTINGGNIESSGTRSYANNITVAGNFTNSGTGNATFSGSVALGAATRTINNDTVSGSRIYSGVISGASGSGLTFTGSGAGQTYIGSSSNTFTGTISINGSEVGFASNGAFGNAANTIIIDGGRLSSASTAAGAVTYTLASTHGIQIGGTAGTSISTVSTGTLTYDGVISDKSGSNGAWAKQGSGTLALGGVSTYSGSTAINNGNLQLTTGNDRLPTGTVVSLGQASSSNLGTLDLNGRNQQIAGLNSTSGTYSGTNTNTVTSTAAATLTIGGSGTYAYSDGTAANSGIISGAISLVKSGSGTQTLGGANTYTGNTTISAGTLALGSAGTLASSPVITVGSTGSTGTVLDLTAKSAFSFAGTQTVKGIGTINIGASKTVTIAGTLAPGNSIGTNTITGNLALTGTLQSELGTSGATASAGVSDRTDVSGNLNLTGSTLQLVNNSGANSQGSAGAGAYRLATYGGSLTGTFSTITNPLSATLHEVVSYGSGNVDLALYRLATATAPTSSVNLGNVRVGDALTGTASITNSASSDGFSEQLKATVTGSGTGFTAVAGGSSGTVNYSLATSAAGVQSGNASVVLKSTGAGTYADTTLSTTAVSLSGAAYNPASAAASQTVNIKTRVDVAGTASVSLANTGAASATYQETLGTTGFSGITDGFTATGSATGIAGGASGSGTLSVGGTFSSSGTYSGSATLGLQTQAVNSSGLGNLAITGQTVNINVTAYDLASPSFTKTSGVGSFGGLSLDFGTVSIGTTYTATFDLANASGAFRDYLGGTFTYTGAGSISSTAADVTSLAAGSSTAFTVTFNPTTVGTYTGTIRFTGLSKQTDLADVQLAAQNIAITGTAIPEPSAYAALVGVGVISAALYRRRRLKAA